MTEINEIIGVFKDQNVQGAVKNLFIYSFLILIVPLASMFLLKAFLFEGFLGYAKSDSMTYSAVIAVVLVHVVLILWISTAWKDNSDQKRYPAKVDKAD